MSKFKAAYLLPLALAFAGAANADDNPITGAVTQISSNTTTTLAIGVTTIVAFTIAAFIQSGRKRAR